MIKYIGIIALLWVTSSLTACSLPPAVTIHSKPSTTKKFLPTNSLTSSPTRSTSKTPSKTPSPTETKKPTVTQTSSATLTASISPSPTIDFPDVTINVNSAHCRYGPGRAYLHAADLYNGDHGFVWNRNYSGTWLWVRFDKLHYACWVAASLTNIKGDVFSVSTYSPPLPKSTLYGPPKKISATRDGTQIVITWEEVPMTEDDDRGYLIEARVCRNGHMIDVAVHTNGTSYTFSDEKTCTGESKGRLYAVEKHGYTDPVIISWP